MSENRSLSEGFLSGDFDAADLIFGIGQPAIFFVLLLSTWMIPIETSDDPLLCTYAIQYAGFLLILTLRQVIRNPVRYPIYMMFHLLVGIPISFGLIYYSLENGKRGSCIPELTVRGEALYFSVSAYTTLVFGDLKPVGVCRAIASVQALFGILTLGAIPGIIIGNIIERRMN